MLLLSALVAGLVLAPRADAPPGNLVGQTDSAFVAKQGDRLDIWNQAGRGYT